MFEFGKLRHGIIIPERSEKINLKEVVEGKVVLNNNILYKVVFDHSYSSVLKEKADFSDTHAFDYSSLGLKERCNEGLDYVIHLRLGDNYIYEMNEHYWDAGARNFFPKSCEITKAKFESQWDVEKILEIVSFLEKVNKRFQVLCDGTASAQRHLRTWTDPVYDRFRAEAMNAVKDVEAKFKDTLGRYPNVSFDNSSVLQSVLYILSAKKVIYTKGGFAVNVSKYLGGDDHKLIKFENFLSLLKLEK